MALSLEVPLGGSHAATFFFDPITSKLLLKNWVLTTSGLLF